MAVELVYRIELGFAGRMPKLLIRISSERWMDFMALWIIIKYKKLLEGGFLLKDSKITPRHIWPMKDDDFLWYLTHCLDGEEFMTVKVVFSLILLCMLNFFFFTVCNIILNIERWILIIRRTALKFLHMGYRKWVSQCSIIKYLQ